MTTKNFNELKKTVKKIAPFYKAYVNSNPSNYSDNLNEYRDQVEANVNHLVKMGFEDNEILGIMMALIMNNMGLRKDYVNVYIADKFVISAIDFDVFKGYSEEQYVNEFKKYLPNNFYYDCNSSCAISELANLAKYGIKIKGVKMVKVKHLNSKMIDDEIPVWELYFKE